MQHVKTLTLLATLLLSGCLATTGTSPLLKGAADALAAATASAATTASPTTASTSPLASLSRALTSSSSDPATAAKPQTAAEFFDLQKAELDLIRPDGSACKAVADGGFASNMMLMGQVGVTLTFAKYTEGRSQSLKNLQASLDSIRPQLKQLSKQVVWLPLEAEVLIGQQMMRMGEYRDWKPINRAQRAFVDGPLTRSFTELKSYAEGELQSPLKFEMRLVRDDNSRTAEMLPGGTLIVNSGLVANLAGQNGAEQTLAFILAHEFSHALRRHTTKSIQGRLVDGLTMAEVFNKQFKATREQLTRLNASNLSGLFNLSTQGIAQITAAVCTTDKWFTDFDQKQELEADTCGALLLDKLGVTLKQSFDPVQGMNRYRALTAGAGTGAKPKGLCLQPASHPEVEAREQNLIRYSVKLRESRSRGKEREGAPGPRGRPD